MKKPLIVITPQSIPMEEPFRETYKCANTYNTSAVKKAGGIPVIAPFLSDEDADFLMASADGLFLSGGADISPAIYGEEKLPCCKTVEEDRDRSDLALLKGALNHKKPVLCICRGLQLANAYFGGTLYQDIIAQGGSSMNHCVYNYPELTEDRTHMINVVPGSPLYKLFGEESFAVNSLHHQGIKDLAPGLVPTAYGPDGIIEGWYLDSEEQWMMAYQWHPEMMREEKRRGPVFRDFVSACLRYSK